MNTAIAGDRQHYWDTLRALLMLLGIPYHVALSYRPGQTWIVRSDEGWAPFVHLAEFIHLFRMPAFFLIAGFFAALLLSRRAPGVWLKQRFMRLGIPFITSIVVLVPILNLACEFSNLPYSRALSSFVWNSTHSGGYWVRHLWFIIVLLYLSSAATLLCSLFPRLRTACVPEGLDRAMARYLLITLLLGTLGIALWEAAAVEAFYIAGLATNVPQQILRLDELIIYTPWFITGVLLQRAPATLTRFTQPHWLMAPLVALTVWLAFTLPAQLHPAPGRMVTTFAAMAITWTLIGVARRWMDRPHALVTRFVDAAFVIYLFHLPIVALLVWLGQSVALAPAAKGLAVMALTLALSWGAWLVILRVPVLAVLFNGTTAGTARPVRPAGAPILATR